MIKDFPWNSKWEATNEKCLFKKVFNEKQLKLYGN